MNFSKCLYFFSSGLLKNSCWMQSFSCNFQNSGKGQLCMGLANYYYFFKHTQKNGCIMRVSSM